jgi:hypothetical protein
MIGINQFRLPSRTRASLNLIVKETLIYPS